jgi:DNA polymerase elongation subunit (family B)
MYRNIYYQIDKEDWQGQIVLFTWDENGKPITQVFPHKSYLYYEHPNGNHTSIFGTPLMKKTFKNVAARKTWIKQNSNIRIFECLPPQREFLLDYYQGQQEDIEFRKHSLRKQFFDIEIKVESEFPNPQEAKYPINVMTFYDSYLEKYFCWVVNETIDFKDEEDIEYRQFPNEKEMLKDYLNWHIKNTPDILTGWNSENFDIPYLVNRIKKFFGGQHKLLSPVKQVRKISRTQKGKSSNSNTYMIEGISCLDYMNLYKYKFCLDNRHSYKLEDIGQEELGYGKLSYDGSIKEFYTRDFKKFVDYNVHDVRLCVELDEKLNYIEMSRIICNFGLCEYECILKSQPYIYGALVLEARERKQKIISEQGEVLEKNNTYEGAHVFKPRMGIYRRGVASVDLNSLYPNVMITLNISPETKVGKIEKMDDGNWNLCTKKGSKTLTQEKLDEILKTKCTKSDNNVLYIKPDKKVGIIPSFLMRLYSKRIKLKNESIKDNKTIEKIKSKDDIDNSTKEKLIKKLKNSESEKDKLQLAFKLFLNSIYGQIGSKYFPMYDIDNAEAVTLSGRYIIKESGNFIDRYFQENYGVEGRSLIYGDTDSNYFDCSPIVNEVLGKDLFFTKENIQKISKKVDKFVDKVNEYCDEICENYFHSPLKRIEFKRETFCTEGAFVAKKRYVLHVRDDEGVPVDKFKYTGVDIKKTELPSEIRDVLKEIVEGMLVENWSHSRYKDKLRETWNKFIEYSPKEIGFWKGYNTEKESDGFLQSEKGSGAHVKAAHYHNDIIEKLGLRERYEKIQVGDRLRFIYVKKANPYRIECIGWKEDFPKEFKEIFEVDYERMFDKVVLSPLKRFQEINNWSDFNPNDEDEFDITEL